MPEISAVAASARMNNSPKMATVLHVASVFPSNSNRLALQFGYVRDKWKVELLHLTASCEDIAQMTNDGLTVHALPHTPRHRKTDSYLIRKLRSLIRRIVDSIALYITELRCTADVMHAHENSSLWALAFWVLVLRRPAVWDPHDYFHKPRAKRSGWLRRAIFKFLERAIVKRGTPILAVSVGMKEKYASLYPDTNIQVIRNYSSQRSTSASEHGSISDTAARRVALRNRLGGESIRLIYPGLIKPERFSLSLIACIGSIKGISLDIYGEDRSGHATHQSALAKVLEDSEIKNVRYCGRYTSDDIISILEQYHFAIFPYEVTHPNIDFCLPNKFYQCIEAGVPLIASNMKEMGEIITQFELGYVFASGDDAACVDILANCSVTGDSYVDLVRNVLNYKTSEIDYEQQQSTLLDTYTAAMKR